MSILKPNETLPSKARSTGTDSAAVPDTHAVTSSANPSVDSSTQTTLPPAVEDTELIPAVEGDALKTLKLKPKIVEQLMTVFDPEIPVNIYELGLIYDIVVDANGLAVIKMTLTAPGCPAAETLPVEVEDKTKSVEGVTDARIDLVWDPPWSKERMSEAAKLELGIFD
jgi:FeS assembly SUF system protein